MKTIKCDRNVSIILFLLENSSSILSIHKYLKDLLNLKLFSIHFITFLHLHRTHIFRLELESHTYTNIYALATINLILNRELNYLIMHKDFSSTF